VGVLTMLDVIEHLGDPLRVLQQLRELLVQNGSIIVLTGATDSVAWRFFGRHYWYSSLPEHVTFYSLKWFRWAASQLGMAVVWHGHVRYERPSPSQWLKRGARLSLYVATQQLRAAGLPEQWLRRLPLIGRAANWRSTPWWMGAKDHILVVLKASDG
jgi:hypothetical protein